MADHQALYTQIFVQSIYNIIKYAIAGKVLGCYDCYGYTRVNIRDVQQENMARYKQNTVISGTLNSTNVVLVALATDSWQHVTAQYTINDSLW